jgi:hypothetical protein
LAKRPPNALQRAKNDFLLLTIVFYFINAKVLSAPKYSVRQYFVDAEFSKFRLCFGTPMFSNSAYVFGCQCFPIPPMFLDAMFSKSTYILRTPMFSNSAYIFVCANNLLAPKFEVYLG